MIDDFYFDNVNGVTLLKCRALDAIGVKHCFTTRKGGVSEGYLSSLNMSFSRENRDNVLENYRRVFVACGFSGNCMLSNQEHTDIVKLVGRINGITAEKEACDGFVTGEKNVCLATFVADCVPVLIADRQKRCIASVHSGWRGTKQKITEKKQAAY